MANHRTSLAQRTQEKLYFDHMDMDYYIYWIVGRRIYGGSDSTECFGFAARIVDGDAESWQREWGDLASRVEDRGRAALGSGEVAGARAAYSRACTLPQN